MEPNESPEKPAQAPDVVLRPAEPGDLEYVASTWRRNYIGNDRMRAPGGLPEDIATQAKVVETCLATSEVVIACPAERHEQILGFVCARPGVVHYVFVKPYYRRHGIGTRLLEFVVGGERVVYHSHSFLGPHRDGIGSIVTMARGQGIAVVYNPALIFGGTTT